ncbi:exodeoxyribonuclease V subunit gamma [Phycisphaera mikurensis]|uniref:Exodeoxyribonuclease V gamma chain n=1 Tax=Phycisphaera mikurensis (strain NBRC 102666 / KCTC 22515 / FYK2301M01) TaxID=1142394 RepID=I0ICH0_PHYMF|nr:exodeoxyribonuclease V subunit gamma [Phycisphaera mikurensis]MBB6442166.1 exodeoxyribonuclease V gamma subunit [Phycisphaera mikurensis]BAM02958.1 exodeoxyribonuclease V gamma chain [Phycisphaera mikurensis NBRC 102666]
MPVRLFESDRFEPLWTRFLEATDPRTAANPLRPEEVVVPGGGWEAWLTRRLARERGAAVRPRCSALAALLLGVQRRAGAADRDGRTFFDVDGWTLRLAAALREERADGPPARWLAAGVGDEDALERRVQLGRRLAVLLDGYLLTRPELVEAMAAEPESLPEEMNGRFADAFAWQARLFGPLLRESGIGPAGPAYEALAEELATGEGHHPAVPARVAVWVSGAVAPAQLRGLEMLDAAGCAVTVLVLAASETYLADLLPASWFGDEEAAELDDPDLHRELPHPLLAAWGQLTRDRQKLLLEETAGERWQPQEVEPAREAAEPADRGLLGALQATIRGARPPEPGMADADGSVVVHGAGGLRRQAEVLRERLLVAFDELPGLRPEDVLVLCPDPEAFAPHVEAVFERPVPGQAQPLTVHLSGRSPRRERPGVSAFFRLLGVLGGRAEAPEVLGLVADPAFATPGMPDAAGAAALGADVGAAGIRFGFDAADRAAEGRPADATHTWEAGLDRLTLGTLLPPPEGGRLGEPVGSVVTLDRAERAETLGALAGFVGRLHAACAEADEPADARAWSARAVAWSEGFLAEGFDDFGRAQVREAAESLAEDAEAAGLAEDLPLSVWSAELGRRLDGVAGGGRFRTGGVTVCEPAAAAWLPHRVVAWLGLSDGSFPRRTPEASFDLAAAEHRPGDRPAAAVDRSLLLGSLMAAGDRFLVVFEDRDTHGDPRAPAAVVVELLEVLRTLVGEEHADAVSPVHHPMHAFSPDAFDAAEPGRQGVEPEMLAAAEALVAGRRGDAPAVAASGDAAAGVEPVTEVPLRDLEDLMCRAWILRLRALGVGADFADAVPEAEDPQELDALEDWQLREALLAHGLGGVGAEEARRRLAAAGRTPAGAMGDRVLGRLAAEAEAVAAAVERAAGAGGLASFAPLTIEAEVDDVRVAGRVERVRPGLHLHATSSRLKAKRRAAAWVRHVVLAAAGEGRRGVVVGRPEAGPGVQTLDLAPLRPGEAWEHLGVMLRWLERARREPLPCDADVAAAFPKDDEPRPSDIEAALARFHEAPGSGQPAAADGPDVKLAFGDADPMRLEDAELGNLQAAMARDLWGPLEACLRGAAEGASS